MLVKLIAICEALIPRKLVSKRTTSTWDQLSEFSRRSIDWDTKLNKLMDENEVPEKTNSIRKVIGGVEVFMPFAEQYIGVDKKGFGRYLRPKFSTIRRAQKFFSHEPKGQI